MMIETQRAISRILLIDDSEPIHEWFAAILSAHNRKLESNLHAGDYDSVEHFEFDSAFRGRDGLEKVRQATSAGEPYSMAFVDVVMPGGWDGIQTTARIWEHDPELQVVLCTGCTDDALEEMIGGLGQSDRLIILKKPFDRSEVMQMAHVLTRKWRLLQESRSRVLDLEGAVTAKTEELQKSEERFRLIAENAADLIVVVDSHGRWLYASPSCEKLFGFDARELEGAYLLEHVHDEDRQAIRSAIQGTLLEGGHQMLECRLRQPGERWTPFELRISGVQAAEDVARNILIVARDVTDRKKAEHERAIMELQLRQAHRLETIGQLAAGIAHEINTPTQYIGDNTRFLQDSFSDLQELFAAFDELLIAARAHPQLGDSVGKVTRAIRKADLAYLQEEIPKAIQQSLEGVERVSRIVRSMKEFSHPGNMEKANVDLQKAIESTITVCRNEWKYVAELTTEFDPALPPVPALVGELNQVLLNLIVNAAHAIADVVGDGSRGKGSIHIQTRQLLDWAEIRISDSGTGIPEHVRPRIFDPFFTTKPVGKGTGQGLAMAHNVISEKHGGSLTFETQVGQGTTFIIRLPLDKPKEK